ncbi:hypothetical protein DXG01_009270 [Tephrocybe rancida]|nr:hypothetical protein DXG01_009270 [Tephrocybe rancida]
MVIRRGVFKGYEGIIREILEDDEVCIELSATLKHETFHLSQLSNLNDVKCKPLIYKYHPEVFQGDMPLPAQPAPIPQSLHGYGTCMESFIKDARLPSAVS